MPTVVWAATLCVIHSLQRTIKYLHVVWIKTALTVVLTIKWSILILLYACTDIIITDSGVARGHELSILRHDRHFCPPQNNGLSYRIIHIRWLIRFTGNLFDSGLYLCLSRLIQSNKFSDGYRRHTSSWTDRGRVVGCFFFPSPYYLFTKP